MTQPAPGRYYPVVGNALRTLVLLAALTAGAFAADTNYAPLTVTGIVTNKQTGEPIAGAMVSIAGERLSATTDSAGRFVIANAPAGPQTIIATAPGYITGTVFPSVLSYRATYTEIALSRGYYDPEIPLARPDWYASVRTGHVSLGLPIDIMLLDVDARWQRFRVGASLGGIRLPPYLTGPTFRAGYTLYDRPLRYVRSPLWGSDARDVHGVYGFAPDVYAQLEVCPWTGTVDELGTDFDHLAVATINVACEYYFARAGVYVGGIAGHVYNYYPNGLFRNWQLLPAFGVSLTLGSFTTGF